MDKQRITYVFRKLKPSDWYGYTDLRIIKQMLLRYGIISDCKIARDNECLVTIYASDAMKEEFRFACYKLKCIHGFEIEKT